MCGELLPLHYLQFYLTCLGRRHSFIHPIPQLATPARRGHFYLHLKKETQTRLSCPTIRVRLCTLRIPTTIAHLVIDQMVRGDRR